MRQKFGRHIESFASPFGDRVADVDSVPVDDDCGEQVEASNPVMLPFGGAVTDFALAADAQRILESMVSLALVETDLGAPLHVRVEDPLNYKECSFHTAEVVSRKW